MCYSSSIPAVTKTKEDKTIQKARRDITRVLERYQVTLPEVMGIAQKSKTDEETWGTIKNDYEKVQEQMFRENYPALWRKIQNQK